MHSLSLLKCPVQAYTLTAVASTSVDRDGTALTSSAIVSSNGWNLINCSPSSSTKSILFSLPFAQFKHTAVEVRRELVSRNLEGDHKIIKFIENCIKSVDGWRFKKSGNPSLRTAYALGNNLMAMPSIKSEVAPLNEDLLPYPMRYASLKGTLEKKSDSSSSSPSAPAAAAATSSSSSAAEQKEAVGLQRPEMFEEAQFIGYADSDWGQLVHSSVAITYCPSGHSLVSSFIV